MTFGKFTVDYEQRIFNPERMRQYRLDRAHTMLKKYGLGSLIVYDYESMRYLGYRSHHYYGRHRPGRFIMLIKDAGWPICPAERPVDTNSDVQSWIPKENFRLRNQMRWMAGTVFEVDYNLNRWKTTAEEVKNVLKEFGVVDLPCGIDTTSPRMVKACEAVGIDVTGNGVEAIAEARWIKNQDEIECCRTAGSISEYAHWEVCRQARPGITELQVVGIVTKALCDVGAGPEFEGPGYIVCSGPRSGHNVPSYPTDRVIRPGEMLILDVNGVSFNGYRTCFYRTYCVGDKPTEHQKEIYESCLECQVSMEKNIKPGLTNHQIAKAIMKEGEGKWWNGPTFPEPGRYYSAGGHSLGLASGDPGPSYGSPSERSLEAPEVTIQPGNVFAVEVGCWDWDGRKWGYDGVKLENTCVVTETGCEVLYRFPYKDLITVGLPGVY